MSTPHVSLLELEAGGGAFDVLNSIFSGDSFAIRNWDQSLFSCPTFFSSDFFLAENFISVLVGDLNNCGSTIRLVYERASAIFVGETFSQDADKLQVRSFDIL